MSFFIQVFIVVIWATVTTIANATTVVQEQADHKLAVFTSTVTFLEPSIEYIESQIYGTIRRESCGCYISNIYNDIILLDDIDISYIYAQKLVSNSIIASYFDECYNEFYIETSLEESEYFEYSCACQERRQFQRVVDDNIRYMRLDDNLLTVVPLWEVEHGHVLARPEDPCAVLVRDWAGDLWPLESQRGAHGLAGMLAGRNWTGIGAPGASASGGGTSGGGGARHDEQPPDDDAVMLPTPVPVPAAVLLFLSGLTALGLLVGLQWRGGTGWFARRRDAS